MAAPKPNPTLLQPPTSESALRPTSDWLVLTLPFIVQLARPREKLDEKAIVCTDDFAIKLWIENFHVTCTFFCRITVSVVSVCKSYLPDIQITYLMYSWNWCNIVIRQYAEGVTIGTLRRFN